ncbi:MAG: M13 family metallopeptidase [Bacteroidales bacterium]|nr:M13 family metallopeptidase [Bacteroidales bacterium]
MKSNLMMTSVMALGFVFLASTTSMATPAKPQKPKKQTSGITASNLDNSVKPTADFYQYACGGWMANNPLGDEYARFGSFDVLGENNQAQLKDLVTKIAAQKNTPGTVEQKIGDFYNTAMNTEVINKQGAQPLQPELQNIAKMHRNDLSVKMARMLMDGSTPFFALFGSADPDNSSMTIAHIWQSGLGIGDRDYYLDKDQQNIRDEYVKLMTKMFSMSNYSAIAGFKGKENEMANRVMALETLLAQYAIDKTVLRDPYQTIHKCTPAEFQKMIPAINVQQYLKTLNLKLDTLNVSQPTYIQGVNNILEVTDFDVIKAYLAWNVIRGAASYLSDEFVDASFDFYGKTLSGRKENRPRWKRVIDNVDDCLGEAVGQMYVKNYFPAEAKQRMEQLVKNLQWALGERIKASTWMTDQTKKNALEKLAAFTVKIGYPDKWRDYSALTIGTESYYANVMNSRRFDMAYNMSKIGKKVDPTEWQMTPQTVNAYYDPTTNEICFPAGILQPPFFDMNADDAANYGAIGVVIGHEMTHGFDDQGRNYDKDGNLADWWTEKDAATFKEKAQLIVDHFNSIEVAPGVFGNGEFTLGENIADNGGLNVSYTAFQKAKKDGQIKGEMDGFTPEQRFFLAYAAVWAANIREAEILRRTKTDPHALGRWRVNATLRHIDPFYEAFNIQPGDPMYMAPEKRSHIW